MLKPPISMDYLETVMLEELTDCILTGLPIQCMNTTTVLLTKKEAPNTTKEPKTMLNK